MEQLNDLALRKSSLSATAAIPAHTADLLYLSTQDPETVCVGFSLSITFDESTGEVSTKTFEDYEPSTIYTLLRVKEPRHPSLVPNPTYYPSYIGLSPEQRWVYLSWLRDIRRPIHIGYVFIYYYGLERQLLCGAYDLAVEELLQLQRFHLHPTFLSYSRCALVCASLMRERRDTLARLYSEAAEPDSIDNYDLIMAHQAQMGLSVSGLLKVARKIKHLNKRYMKEQPQLLSDMMANVLSDSFNGVSFPFYSFCDLEDLPKKSLHIFANVSLPRDIRSQALPNFFDHPPFVNRVALLYQQAHKKTKEFLVQQRKARKCIPPQNSTNPT